MSFILCKNDSKKIYIAVGESESVHLAVNDLIKDIQYKKSLKK